MANNEKKKILLVDDDDIQLTIAEILLKDEYDIYKALSGNDALKYFYGKNFTPDLILLDILMPFMDGWEVFNRIKAIGFLKNVPIAFLTSVDGVEAIDKAFKLGSADFITKPYKQDELKKRIKKILEKKTD